MTQYERSGFRDQAFSSWHRPDAGYLNRKCYFADIDWVEYYYESGGQPHPLAFYELKCKSPNNNEKAEIATMLAQLCGVLAYLIFYDIGGDGYPETFHVKQVFPAEEKGFLTMVRQEMARYIEDVIRKGK